MGGGEVERKEKREPRERNGGKRRVLRENCSQVEAYESQQGISGHSESKRALLSD